MTDRLLKVRSYVNHIFQSAPTEEDRRVGHLHSYGVSGFSALLARKRGLDPQLASAIGLVHDLYTYKTGLPALHSQNGAEMVRVALSRELEGLFTPEEQIIMLSAIYHHSDKSHVHDGYDELLKDADRLQHWQWDPSTDQPLDRRLHRALQGLSMPVPEEISPLPPEETKSQFARVRLVEIAQDLARRRIVGTKRDGNFQAMTRYFPEEGAVDEFVNAWCAAFVYHCALLAGLPLPIRVDHNAKTTVHRRFGSVLAWYEWGRANGYCHREEEGFHPQRGDIVIYHNIIPEEQKPDGSSWCDHMGIVLALDGELLTVAEGNVGNRNVSGIVVRDRDHTVGFYLRIPDNWMFVGWKEDFKTGLRKTVELE